MNNAIIPIGIEYSQMLKDLGAVVRHELQALTPAPTTAPPADDPLSIREAATMLGVTVQTVHEWKRLGLLKYHKLGGRSYLKRSDVDAALKEFQRTKKGR